MDRGAVRDNYNILYSILFGCNWLRKKVSFSSDHTEVINDFFHSRRFSIYLYLFLAIYSLRRTTIRLQYIYIPLIYKTYRTVTFLFKAFSKMIGSVKVVEVNF